MVEVVISGHLQLQSCKTYVIKRFVVYAVSLIAVFDKLLNSQGGIVRFHDYFRHLKINLLRNYNRKYERKKEIEEEISSAEALSEAALKHLQDTRLFMHLQRC